MRTLTVVSLLVALSACSGGGDEAIPDAVVADVPATETKADAAPAAPAADAGAASAGETEIDTAKSKLGFVGSKVVGSHPITVNDYTGFVRVTDGKVSGVRYTAKMATVEADHPKLTAHLLNADFFDVEKYPESTFVSTEIKEGGEGGTHTVTGDLTVVGKTKRITFPATITTAGSDVTASAKFEIDRRDFDVIYPGMKDNLVQDIVPMTIEFVAPGAVSGS